MNAVQYAPVRAVVTDIEGTTTAISFVFDTLFPYARQHLPGFIRTHRDVPAVQAQLDAVNTAADQTLDLEAAIATLLRWIDEDRKLTPLKSLQGMIWAEGYRRGELKGHIYADAVEALRDWHATGRALYVYSSGSVQAQKLIFGHTDYGDLTPLFSGYFDTTTGPKREAESYRRIAESIGTNADAMLFLSDVQAELDAARQAGMQTGWLLRNEDEGLDSAAAHPQVRSFAEIRLG